MRIVLMVLATIALVGGCSLRHGSQILLAADANTSPSCGSAGNPCPDGGQVLPGDGGGYYPDAPYNYDGGSYHYDGPWYYPDAGCCDYDGGSVHFDGGVQALPDAWPVEDAP